MNNSYPVLQIVRCQLDPDAAINHAMGYPMAPPPHLHPHISRISNHAYLTRNYYQHPCGTLKYFSS